METIRYWMRAVVRIQYFYLTGKNLYKNMLLSDKLNICK